MGDRGLSSDLDHQRRDRPASGPARCAPTAASHTRPIPPCSDACRSSSAPPRPSMPPAAARSATAPDFAGRSTIVEVLVMSDAIRHLVLAHAEGVGDPQGSGPGRHAVHAPARHAEGTGWAGRRSKKSLRRHAVELSHAQLPLPRHDRDRHDRDGRAGRAVRARGDRGNPQSRPLSHRSLPTAAPRLRKQGGARSSPGSFCPRARFSARSLVVATQELAALMLAGLELDRALEILVGLDETKSMRPVFAALLEQVRGGSGFADASRARTVFPRFYVSIVHAGEQGGDPASGAAAARRISGPLARRTRSGDLRPHLSVHAAGDRPGCPSS